MVYFAKTKKHAVPEKLFPLILRDGIPLALPFSRCFYLTSTLISLQIRARGNVYYSFRTGLISLCVTFCDYLLSLRMRTPPTDSRRFASAFLSTSERPRMKILAAKHLTFSEQIFNKSDILRLQICCA